MNEVVFENMILCHLDSMYAFARILATTHEHAEDLVQDTYLKATQNRSKYQHNTNCKAWLFTVMKNLFLNDYRHRKREVLFGSFLSEEGEDSHLFIPISINPTPDLKMDLQKALATLPEDLQLVVMLRDQEGLEYREIAAIFCCPVGTVMSRLARGRARIKIFFMEQ